MKCSRGGERGDGGRARYIGQEAEAAVGEQHGGVPGAEPGKATSRESCMHET